MGRMNRMAVEVIKGGGGRDGKVQVGGMERLKLHGWDENGEVEGMKRVVVEKTKSFPRRGDVKASGGDKGMEVLIWRADMYGKKECMCKRWKMFKC
jgi:hypothetical protein